MIEQQRVYRIKDLDSLLGFLREDLCWELPEASIDDVSFEWTGLDLNLSEDINKKLKGGLIRQLQPFATHQPWGIFVVEFATHEVSIITLRQILRCFVAKRRGARPDLPAWQCENLLFICLYGENGFTFAHFEGDKPYSSKLTTFSWHPGEPIRTVCEFNLPALVYDYTWTPETWVEEWQKAFDVEKVNKDFYRQIARFYYRLTGKEGQKRELVLPYVGDDSGSISIYEEFAVRLIGRSIFCWFLKHKESANNVPLIPPEALSLAAARETADFYHSMLEPLFFEVMNKRINERKPLPIPRSELIPFLNGGLFEQHPSDFYPGVANYGLKIADAWFIDFFSLLGRYNFTITENSSIDVDVAVDPEMLGRIFENLLAEVVPETGETARKATGSYYTPRAIVDYMVEQSLKQYLLTKTELGEEKINRLVDYGEDIEDFSPEEKLAAVTALREIKVIDPACGSGAFLMGILHRMLAVLEKVDLRLELWRTQYLKSLDGIVRQTVEKNISRENWAYIRKLMIIRDSIYGVDIQPIAVEIAKLRCFLSLVVDEAVIDGEENQGIEPLPNLEFKFVAANTLIGLPEITDMGIMENRELIDELATLRKEYFGDSGENKEKIKQEFKAVQAKLSEHYRKLLITEKTDFTGATRKLEMKEATQTQLLAEWDPFSYRESAWFDPEWMFGEDGFDIAIANPPYINIVNVPDIHRQYYQNNYQITKNKVDLYAYFIERSEQILKNDATLCFIIPQTWKATDSFSKFRKLIFSRFILNVIVNLEFGTFGSIVRPVIVLMKKTAKIPAYKITIHDRSFETIGFIDINEILKSPTYMVDTESTEQDKLLFEKIEKKCIRLEQALQFTRGIKTSDDNRFIHYKKQNNEYKKVFRGKNIKAYHLNWAGEYIWYKPDLMKQKVGCLPHSKELFEVPEKLITQRVNSSMQLLVAYDDRQNYFLDTTNVSKCQTLNSDYAIKFILAILNSKLINYWYCNKYRMPTIGLYELHSIPIKPTLKNNQKPFTSLVDQILAITKDADYPSNLAKQAKVKELERQIDQMVYELYGLTPEEIGVVEGGR